MLINFLSNLRYYFLETIPILIIGFLLSGIIHEFIPQNLINRYLRKKDIFTLLKISILGIILPICCFGVLPISVTFKKKGIPLGPILTFLVTTPATSITAILMTYQFLGLKFTIFLCLAIILMGIIIGISGNLLKVEVKEEIDDNFCPMCEERNPCLAHQQTLKKRLVSMLTYSFIDLPKEIGLELLIGIILAAIVVSVAPIGILIEKYLSGSYGYLFAIIFGLSMYICATGSVPLVAAFLSQGLNIGASLTLLLCGPITSYGTILVIKKEFGFKTLFIYLGLVSLLSLFFGYLFTYF